MALGTERLGYRRCVSAAAPAWVTYAALLMSAASLLIAWLGYRAGGPRLRLRAASIPAPGSPFPNGSPVRLTVINGGRGAVTVQGFCITPYGERKAAATVDEVDGPDLPYRLEPHATQSWCVNVLPAAHAYDAQIRSGAIKPKSSWPSKFRFSVAAGNGRNTHSPGLHDSLRIIADSSKQQP
jgi:hypothetical protein